MDEFKVVGLKFVKGFISGFLATAVVIIVPRISNIGELEDWLFSLGLAGIVGGIVGAIQAAYKSITWKTDEELLEEIKARVEK